MVDMKFLFPILFIMAVVSVQAQNSVRLKGKLVGMGTDLVKLSYDGATSVIGDGGELYDPYGSGRPFRYDFTAFQTGFLPDQPQHPLSESGRRYGGIYHD